jgi:hypothetical protein
MYQNWEKIYQTTTKLPNDHNIPIPKDHKMYQRFPIQGPPKFSQIGIFGSKIYTIWQP